MPADPSSAWRSRLDQNSFHSILTYDLAGMALPNGIFCEKNCPRPQPPDLTVAHLEFRHPFKIDKELPLGGFMPTLSEEFDAFLKGKPEDF